MLSTTHYTQNYAGIRNRPRPTSICNYLNDCSLSCQFYTKLKYPSQLYMYNKRIVPGKKFIAIASIVYLVGMTKNQDDH